VQEDLRKRIKRREFERKFGRGIKGKEGESGEIGQMKSRGKGYQGEGVQ